jgi:hypothetical protein
VVSALFFVISELASIEPMYQYSLAWFVALFEVTLAQADKARDLGKRIDNLVAHFQYSLYVQVSGQVVVTVCKVGAHAGSVCGGYPRAGYVCACMCYQQHTNAHQTRQ